MSDYEVVGNLANKATHHALSVKCAENVYSLASTTEEIISARKNLITSYIANNNASQALFYSEQYVKEDPQNFDAQIMLAASLKFTGRLKDSYAILDSLYATNISSDQKKALRFTQSYKHLKAGNVALGVNHYIKKVKNSVFDLRDIPKWNGNTYKNKKLYINDGGGVGDQFINMRFYYHIRDLGMIPILYSQLQRNDVNAIIRRHGFDVITESTLINQDSMWCNLLELPVLLNATEDDLWSGQYLFPNKQDADLLSPTRLKIGIKTNGNPYFGQDVYRKISPHDLIDVLPHNADIYNFDMESTHPNTITLKEKISSWDDTLNYIQQMDIIVSSCTSVAHAASAMNKKTIVLVPITEYYVWTSSRTDNTTPWYSDNTKIIRQTHPGEWNKPLNNLNALIAELLQND
jgi:tetratricopeptide (TPR) repeat protein